MTLPVLIAVGSMLPFAQTIAPPQLSGQAKAVQPMGLYIINGVNRNENSTVIQFGPVLFAFGI